MRVKRMQASITLSVVLACVLAPLAHATESAASAYKAGQKAEKKNDYETAFRAYKRAHEDKPDDPKYMAAYLRLRSSDSTLHIHSGQLLHDQGDLQGALAQYKMAALIDPSNFEALGLMRRTTDEIETPKRLKDAAARAEAAEDKLAKWAENAPGPVELHYKADLPVSIQMTTTTDVLYKTLGKLGGINVLVDPEYKPQKLSFELKDVTLRDALSMLAVQSKTFWRPLSSNTILVTSDTGSKRKDLEQSVMKTFYLKNAATPEQLQEAAGTLKGILDISHIQVTPELRSLTLRGTPDQMIFAQKLLSDLDKPKGEVQIEVVVMEVSRDRLRTLGANLPTTVTAQIAPAGSSSSSGGTSSGSNGFTLTQLANLSSDDIQISFGSASFTALASDSNTKVIQRPEIRAIDSEKATLKIGDRIPIATGSFQSGLTQGVNTQFQYIDVGVNVDITPYIHAENDVTLKLSLEISSVTGETTISGVTQPTIGQRRIEHEVRLADGEVNLIAGLLSDSESKSMSGWPGLIKIPILKYLFGQESKQRQQSEVVFAVTPHIVRSNHPTEDNLKMVDLGSPTAVIYRAQKSEPAPPSNPNQPGVPAVPPGPAVPGQRPSVPKPN